MSHELDPKVGRWYRRLDNEQMFKVVSIDEDNGLVEIKMVDAEIEELDSADWIELDLELAEAPEDFIDTDEDTDGEETEEDEDLAGDAKPKRRSGRGSREDSDDEDDDDDDRDDDDGDDDYDSDR